MKLFTKKIESKYYLIKIKVKSVFVRNTIVRTNLIEDLIKSYSTKKKIVVLCSGPSALKVKLSNDCLYLITNSGYSLVSNHDFIYYINDGFFIKKTLASASSFLKKNQKILFFYQNSNEHKKGFDFLNKYSSLLNSDELYFLTKLIKNDCFIENYEQFTTFYQERNLPIKIQNSGMFLLLFGYMLSVKMNLPLDLYGLDLGLGGNVHYDNKGVVGKSVFRDRVKENVKMYLSFMYNEKKEISNYSNFSPNK